MKLWETFVSWVNGDEREQWYSSPAMSRPRKHRKKRPPLFTEEDKHIAFEKIYAVIGVFVAIVMAAALLTAVTNLPTFGEAENPTNNELPEYYIEHGLEDGGAANLVGNMILSYRVFDTLGESCVLFLAATAVTMLLARDGRNTPEKLQRYFEREDRAELAVHDRLVRTVGKTLLPVIVLFSLYIMVNGHLSPGGGFAGGSILGGGLILFAQEFGTIGVRSFFSEKMYNAVRVTALAGYGIIVLYFAFMGANGLDNHIWLGIPGTILSSGIILPINIMVGFVVTCTVYAFYCMFHKGEI